MKPVFSMVPPERPLRQIRIHTISRNPYQPRKYFDPDSLTQLTESIRQYGILNPLTVRKKGGGYELIAGERRLRAARAAGLAEVPCIVMSADEQDSSAIALVENLQRRDLDFFEEAFGYRQLIEPYGLTQEEAARRVGKTQSALANKLRLLKLSAQNMQMIRGADLTERHARALLRLTEEEDRIAVTEYIIAYDLNVGKTEQYIERLLMSKQEQEKTPKNKMLRLLKDVRFFLNTVDRAVSVMQEAGVAANVEREESESGMLVKILIPTVRKAE